MIKVKVRSILDIIDLMGGQKEQIIELEDQSLVVDLIDHLIDLYGDSLRKRILDEKKNPRPGIAMFINGRNIFALEGFKTRLNMGDVFLIFPPVGGG